MSNRTKEIITKSEGIQAPDSASIRSAFTAYLKSEGKRPSSLKEFGVSSSFNQVTLKEHYKSLAELEKDVWVQWFDQTITILNQSEEYMKYGAQERLLAFYYTWFDTVKPYRAYLINAPAVPKIFTMMDWFLREIKQSFLKYAGEIVQLAAENQEIVKRPVLLNLYDKILWQQFLFVMNFWIKDKSEEQTNTDEAIERAVQLSIELAGRTQLDAIADFGKFLWKNN